MSSYDGSVVPWIPNMNRSKTNSKTNSSSKLGDWKKSWKICKQFTNEVDRCLGTAVVKCCTDCNNDPGNTRSSRNARCLDCFKDKKPHGDGRGSKKLRGSKKKRGSKSMKRRGSKKKRGRKSVKRRGSKSMKRRGRKSVKRRGMKKRRK